MKKLFPFFLFLALTFSSQAQAPSFDWAISEGSSSADYSTDIAIDQNGNSYITGFFQGTVDFDPGSGTENRTSNGGRDIFIQKLDPSGDLIWVVTLGGISHDQGYHLDVASSGDLYITGSFQDNVDFDPGNGTTMISSQGSSDIFLMKLNGSGGFEWAHGFGSSNSDYGRDVKVSSTDMILIAGSFQDTMDLDPGSSTDSAIAVGGQDIYVAKYDPAGNLHWSATTGSGATDYAYGVTSDSRQSVYLTGLFSNTVDFDPGPGTQNMTSNGGFDMYVLKLDSTGGFEWAHSMGSSGGDYGYNMDADGMGNIFITGGFHNTVDFDPGSGVSSHTSAGQYDGFALKMDTAGNHVWSGSIGGADQDYGRDIDVVGSGDVYLTGTFEGTSDLDPGTGVDDHTSTGMRDIFVEKLDPSGNMVWSEQVGGSDEDFGRGVEAMNSGQVYVTGFFNGVADFDPGTGSYDLISNGSHEIYVMRLLQCQDNSANLNVSSCGDYTVPSGDETYSASGTYNDTIPNAGGCDSVMTINLTVNSSSSASISETSCNDYTVPSGDETYNSGGTYMDTIPNSMGCDSIITIDLTINTVDTSVSNSGSTLTSNAAGASYQWLDCDGGYTPISGETGQSFTPSTSGNYAVAVTENNCTDTSSCYQISLTGIEDEKKQMGRVRIHPNPNNGSFVVVVPNIGVGEALLRILDLQGKEVYSSTVRAREEIRVSSGSLPMGMYILELESERNVFLKKLIIQE